MSCTLFSLPADMVLFGVDDKDGGQKEKTAAIQLMALDHDRDRVFRAPPAGGAFDIYATVILAGIRQMVFQSSLAEHI